MRTRTTRRIFLVLVIGTGGAFTAARALSQTPTSPVSRPASADPQRSVAGTVDPQLAASFAIFRREAQATDALPAKLETILGRSGSTSIGGANPALARRSIATPAGQIFAVAGNAQLCVVVDR
jgi:hypothetical protein